MDYIFSDIRYLVWISYLTIVMIFVGLVYRYIYKSSLNLRDKHIYKSLSYHISYLIIHKYNVVVDPGWFLLLWFVRWVGPNLFPFRLTLSFNGWRYTCDSFSVANVYGLWWLFTIWRSICSFDENAIKTKFGIANVAWVWIPHGRIRSGV